MAHGNKRAVGDSSEINAANTALFHEQANQKLENIRQQVKRAREGVGPFQDATPIPPTRGFKVPQTNAMKIGGTVALDRLYGKSEPGGIHQILGVVSPGGGATKVNLFTVLGKHTARMSVLWVANRRLIPAKIRVGFDVAGGGTNIVPDAAWLYYNVEVPAESTLVLDAATGFWLGAADDVVVYTDISGVSFGASGVEYATV